jgi:protein-S-isoprenylcysteine O-methyltransferase Ste14
MELALTLHVVNFGVIGSLPFTFFKRGGSFNAMWWLTASPQFLCVALLGAGHLGLAPGLTPRLFGGGPLLLVVSSALALVSMALIAATVRAHRLRIALWHQHDDAPAHIVTSGPYRYVRHPFYAAFLLALAGAFLFSPQPGTLLTLALGLAMLTFTAAREERRLQASAFGAEYATYLARTGRFLPRMHGT